MKKTINNGIRCELITLRNIKQTVRTACSLASVFFLLFAVQLISCAGKSEKLHGYLYLRLASNPTTLDPALITDVAGGALGAKIFNGLVRLDERLIVVPDVAKKWDISDDGKSYMFVLKEGITFSNGKEVTAQDFKYSFERLLTAETRSPNTWVLEKIKGAEDFMTGRAEDVAGIMVKGRYTLAIALEETFTPFLNLLCMTAAYAVPKEDVDSLGADFSTRPSGSGPFVLAEWKHNQFLKLDARKDYFEGSPHIYGIVYRIIPDDLTAVAEFESGNIDVISIPASEFRRYRESHEWKNLIAGSPGINTYYLGLSCNRHPFDNLLLRKAVTYAIDRKKILASIYEGRGMLASGPLPPMLRNWPAPEFYEYSPQKARLLLKEAGYPDGLTIIIYLTADQEVLDIVEVIQGYLMAVGIKAELRQLEWSAYKEAINSGEADAFWLSWWADYPDPENFLFPLFHSSNFGPSGNRTRYRNIETDELIERGQRTLNKKLRDGFYQKAEANIVSDAPWVIFWHRTEYTVRQPWVKNYKIYPVYSIDKGMDIGL